MRSSEWNAQPAQASSIQAEPTRRLGGNTRPVMGYADARVSTNAPFNNGGARGASFTQAAAVSQGAAVARGAARKRAVPRWAKVLLAVLVLAIVGATLYSCYLENIMSLGDRSSETRQALAPSLGTDPFYLLVAGTDSRIERSDEMGRADVIMLLRVDPKQSLITAVSIPRDTPWVDTNGRITRINEATIQGGPSALIMAVRDLTGASVSHYAELDFGGFADIVDALGGITVDVPVTVRSKDAYTGEYVEVPAGTQTLNGQQATSLVRARHEYGDNQEAVRQSVVRMVMQAMLAQAKEVPVQNLPLVAKEAAECVNTDVSIPHVIGLIPSVVNGATYYSASGPYVGGIDDAAEGQWLCFENPDGWARLMAMVDAGEDPSGISYDEDYVTVAGTGAPPA